MPGSALGQHRGSDAEAGCSVTEITTGQRSISLWEQAAEITVLKSGLHW